MVVSRFPRASALACCSLLLASPPALAVEERAPALGVRLAPVPEALAAHLGVEGGALLEEILPGSPAEKAGLKRFDIVLSAGDKEVRSPRDLQAAVREKKPGDELELGVRRGAETLKVRVTLGESPAGETPKKARRGFLGVRYTRVPDPLRAQLGLAPEEGVLVSHVLEDSAAARAGLEKYDVILSVAGEKVTSQDAGGPEPRREPFPLPPAVEGPWRDILVLEAVRTNLPDLIARHREGETIEIEVLHQGKRQAVKPTLGAAPEEGPARPRLELWRDDRSKPRSIFRGKLFFRGPDGKEHKIEIPPLGRWPDLEELEKTLKEVPLDLRARLEKLVKKYEPGWDLDFDALELELHDWELPDVLEWRGAGHSLRVVKRVEGDEEVTVRDEDGKRTVTVKRAGEVLAEELPFDRIETLPEEVRRKVEDLVREIEAPRTEVRRRSVHPPVAPPPQGLKV